MAPPAKRGRKSSSDEKMPFRQNPVLRRTELLTWVFEDMYEWNGNVIDSQFSSDRFTWKVEMEKDGNIFPVYMIFSVRGVREEAWFCQAKINPKLYSKNQKLDGRFVDERKDQQYTFYGFEDADNRELVGFFDVSENMGMKDFLKIEVEFDFSFYNFYEKLSSIPTINLKIYDKEFVADKYNLVSISKYFYDCMLDEKDNQEVKINDVILEEFVIFLAAICPNGIDVTSGNYNCLLKLAELFGVPSLSHKCEEYVIGAPESDLHIFAKLEIADRHNMERCMDKIIAGFKTREEVQTVSESRGFDDLKTETQLAIYRCTRKFDNVQP